MTADDTMAPMHAASERLIHGFHERLAGLGNVGADVAALQASVAGMGWTLPGLIAAALAVIAASIAVFVLARRQFAGGAGSSAFGKQAATVMAALLAVVVGWLLVVSFTGQGQVRRSFLPFVFLVPAALVVRGIVIWIAIPTRDGATHTFRTFANRIGLAIFAAFLGAAATVFLAQLGAGRGLLDAMQFLLIGAPFVTLVLVAYWTARKAVATELVIHTRGFGWLRRIASVWPGVAIGMVIIAFLMAQMLLTAGQNIPAIPAISTLMLVMLSPHVDGKIARWAAAGLNQGGVSLAKVAFRRTLRPAVLTLIIVALLAVWSAPIAGLTGLTMSDTMRPTIAIGAIILASAFVQNLLAVAVDRALEEEAPAEEGHEGEVAPRSRLGTLLPLVGGVAKIATVTLAGLTILLALGVNIWPLVTGLSVFGLAIGFGSQTLVKDIVSGLFFLFDDAFRHGEYIETSGAKGTVEKISIRSVSLRHPRGAVATVPYGQIGKINNFSRDWAIEKMTFRVAFDTDVDKVRKLFKAIGKDLLEDPELVPDIIETFKSQGIAEVDEGTLILRGKFKAKAGRQFNTRKAVMAAVHKAFTENGIRTVPRPGMP